MSTSGPGFGGAAADEGDDVVGAQGGSWGRVLRAEAPSRPEGSAGQDPQERFHAHLGREEPNQTVRGGLGKSQHGFVFLGCLCGSGVLEGRAR
jgi:hypothetical protein